MKILPYFLILFALACVLLLMKKQMQPAAAVQEGIVLNGDEAVELPPEYVLTEDDLAGEDVSGEATVLTDTLLREQGALGAGVYVLSGDYRETVRINAQDRIVHLILDNANVLTSDGPAVYVQSAAKVVITAKEGTENTLADCAYHSDKDLPAAIFSNADLTVNGSGTLKVIGYYKDAISTNRIFKAAGDRVTLRVKAKRDTVSADDGIFLQGALLVAEAERNALKTDSHKSLTKGNIYILGGENDLIAGNTAIRSGADLYVNSCRLSMSSVVQDMEIAGEQYIGEGCL